MPTIAAGNSRNLDSKFQARDVEALKAIIAECRPLLEQVTRNRMADAPPDIQEEPVQELLLDLWARGAEDYNPARGQMRTYLMGRLMTAIRRVRATYTPAGERSRRTRSTRNETSATAQESNRASMRTFDDTGEVVSTDEAFSESGSAVATHRIDDEFDARAIMARAQAVGLDEALARIHWDEASIVKVAHDIGIARTTLDYRLRRFYEDERTAA